jgi:hypothetical protein
MPGDRAYWPAQVGPWFFRGKWHAHKPYGYPYSPAVAPAEPTTNNIGAGSTVATMVGSVRTVVDTAMAKVRNDVAGETAALVTEIKCGSSATKRTLQAQSMAIRAEFGNIVDRT